MYHEYSDNLSSLIWKKPGTYFDYVKYVFDGYHLYISGDLGSAVVELTEKASISSLRDYHKSVMYFIEKIECTTDKYDFDSEVALEELKEHYECWCDGASEEEVEEINSLFESLKAHAEDGTWSAVGYSDVRDDLLQIDPDCWEWLDSIGRTVSTRVIMWLVGLNMAYEQIKGKLKT